MHVYFILRDSLQHVHTLGYVILFFSFVFFKKISKKDLITLNGFVGSMQLFFCFDSQLPVLFLSVQLMDDISSLRHCVH